MSHAHEPPEPPALYAVRDDLDTDEPHDLPAEQAVIGSMLLSTQAITDATDTLYGTEFYRHAHELIWRAAINLRLEGAPVDTVTVAARLQEQGDLGRAGGAPYLHELITGVVSPASASYYAQIVRDRAARRALRAAGRRIHHLAGATGAGGFDAIAQAATEALTKATADHTATSKTTSTWQPVDLAGIRAGACPRPTATLLTTNTGRGLLYPGAIHSVSGEPTAGKSWVAIEAVAQEIATGHPVLYVDFEDRAETLLARLDDMGAKPETVEALVRYIRPETALDPQSGAHLDTSCEDCRVAIVDGVTEGMTMHDLDLSKNPDVAKWLKVIPWRLANHGCAVLQIDHVVKDAEARGRYAIGGQHKLAGIVASYTMVVAKPFAPGKAGHARLVVAKDRHGNVGTVGETVAELHMTPDAARSSTAVNCSLTASTYRAPEAEGQSTGPRLTGYMEKVSRVLELTPGMSQKDLLKACGGRETYILSAVQSLAEEGFLRVEKGGAGVATKHFSLAPFREEGAP
jgi:hypothetical protein